MFNIKGFLCFTYTALFKAKGTHYRLTPKRTLWVIVFCLVYPLLELLTWAGLLLDEVLFGRYRAEEIRQPVFIIGNPRSGTTFLHRLMAKDTENMLSMRTWEIYFAPSITQRKLLRALSMLDRSLGGLVHKALCTYEQRCQDSLVTHELALWEPEEDEFMLVHIWSSLVTCVFSAVMEEAEAYTHFDTALSPTEKRRIMTFYVRCLQRHLYVHRDSARPKRHYLAKGPALSAKVGTLLEWFPDAKFVYLVRDPVDVIPSYISVIQAQWRALGDPLVEWAGRDYVFDMTRHWYDYPLQCLEQAPQNSYVVVRYEDLVSNPSGTVTHIYRNLGIDLDPRFSQVLSEEADQARHYRSRHHYSPEQMGLGREQIEAEYEDVYERFGLGGEAYPEREQQERPVEATPSADRRAHPR
jgi:hypothetical protein